MQGGCPLPADWGVGAESEHRQQEFRNGPTLRGDLEGGTPLRHPPAEPPQALPKPKAPPKPLNQRARHS